MPITSPNAKEPVLVAFGDAVRAARLAVGISQEELAHISGIDRSYLGAIERGEQNAGLLHLVRIAQSLNVPLAELMVGAGL
ncbi:helix-turn-helix domain-containing protein [Duganella violaceipulchra]|uniref:Helix-turn-helix domain-containing protein n=1 Tax=Duganella violaceipulchra TaxID=2849652 RepID=A0AA41HJB6_9BURK|nr:helix-turn-helix transcriptional regulator [Duganella violaceicalia]MBV6324893.1 helix-turn-helix domain-containing protein [Duganella violaceicalia]